MLIIDVIDGDSTKTINIPTDWEDMTLSYWCGIYKIIEKYKKRAKLSEGIVDEKQKEDTDFYTEKVKEAELDFLKQKDVLKMNKELFQYIGDISDEDIERVDMDKALDVLSAMSIFQEEYVPKFTNSFEFEGETYYFPKDNMKKNTFGDYIESTQLDMYADSLTHGNFDVLPEQMAILCRREDEEFDEDIIQQKAEKFKKLTMDIVWEFSFFLTEQSQRLEKVLRTYSEEREEVEAL
jgi:hypothetical protein